MPREDTVELKSLFALLRRWAWLIAICILLAAAVAYVVTSRMAPQYRATATLMVSASDDPKVSEYNTLVAAERLALMYSQMLKQRTTLQAAVSQLGVDVTPESLAKKIKVDPVKETQLLRVTVTDSSPERAALLANGVSEAFISEQKSLQDERAGIDRSRVQVKMDEQLKLVQQTQSAIDDARARKVSDDTQLANLQVLLANYRTEQKAAEQQLQTVQQTVERVKGTVSIVDTTRVVPAARGTVSATVTLMVGPAFSGGETDYTSILAGERLAGTYAQMVVGRSVLESAIADSKVGENADALAQRVNAVVVPETQLIRLSVIDANRDRATQLAEAVARAFVAQVQALLAQPYTGQLSSGKAELDRLSGLVTQTQATLDARTAESSQAEAGLARLEDQLAEYRRDYLDYRKSYEDLGAQAAAITGGVSFAERAAVPTAPVLNRSFYILIAAAVAALAALAMAFLIEYLNRTIRTPEEISATLGLATVGTIRRMPRAADELIMVARPQSPTAEAFRILASNLRLGEQTKPLRTLLVTSTTFGEGKTVVAANLAVALAAMGQRVIVVDGDLRAPRLHTLFGLDARNGLTDALLKESLDGKLRSTPIEGLQILPSGRAVTDPIKEFSSPYLPTLLAELESRADIVLVDSPPLLAAAETTILAAATDGVLFVVRSGRTPADNAQMAATALQRVAVRWVGAVLNADATETRYRYQTSTNEAPEAANVNWRPQPQAASAGAAASAARASEQSEKQTGAKGNR